MSFVDFGKRLDDLVSYKLFDFISEIMDSHKDKLVEIQKMQLRSGIGADGEKLTPSYSNDPFFKTRESAIKYSKFKEYRNGGYSNPIFGKKDKDTPDLIVTGTLVHDTIFAEVSDNSLIISARSSLLSKLESKYNEPFGFSKQAWDYFAKEYLIPELTTKIHKYLKG